MKQLQTTLTNPADQTLGAFMVEGDTIGVGINLTRTSGSVVVTILGFDEIANQTFTLLASASLAVTGYTWLTVGPDITAVANVSAAAVVPRKIKILVDVTSLVGTIAINGHNLSPQA